MGRKSKRNERRKCIVKAFAKVLSYHGYSGATIIAVADEAGLSPGLLHHHFKNKREMLFELFEMLSKDFLSRIEERAGDNKLDVNIYLEAALKLDFKSDSEIAKCWVGIMAEALKDKTLMNKMNRYIDSQIIKIKQISSKNIETYEASAILAYIFGSLVFGAFSPRKTSGFASQMGKVIASALQ